MNYIFTLDQSEVQILAMGLSELPLKTSGALFTKIQRVVTEQDSARAASVAEVNLVPINTAGGVNLSGHYGVSV